MSDDINPKQLGLDVASSDLRATLAKCTVSDLETIRNALLQNVMTYKQLVGTDVIDETLESIGRYIRFLNAAIVYRRALDNVIDI